MYEGVAYTMAAFLAFFWSEDVEREPGQRWEKADMTVFSVVDRWLDVIMGCCSRRKRKRS